MANKRMFSKEITNTDRFQSMKLSAQALYFHLGINADDDGFDRLFITSVSPEENCGLDRLRNKSVLPCCFGCCFTAVLAVRLKKSYRQS